MIDRILDFSAYPAFLRMKLDNLVIQRDGYEDEIIPFPDIAAIIVAHKQVCYTQAVLASLSQAGGIFIACDEKSMPVGMLLPLASHSTQVERMAIQLNASEPLKKRLWQQIIIAKVKAQGELLKALYQDDCGLYALSKQIKSGDTTGIEGQAARRYWPALFQRKDFKRDRDANDENRFLNYGYAVLRAIITRAICGSGLHPTVSLHHHNRYNAFCLADDLMEPFRPIVDNTVIGLVEAKGRTAPMTRDNKHAILHPLTKRFLINGEMRTLFDLASRLTASLAAAYSGEGKSLSLPDKYFS